MLISRIRPETEGAKDENYYHDTEQVEVGVHLVPFSRAVQKIPGRE